MTKAHKPDMAFYSLIALIQACLLVSVHLLLPNPSHSPRLYFWELTDTHLAAHVVILAIGSILLLADNSKNRYRLVSLAGFTGLVITMETVVAINHYDHISALLLTSISSFALLSFVQGFHQTERWPVKYTRLFEVVWQNLCLLLSASIIFILIHALTWLAGYLFASTGYHSLNHWLDNRYYLLASTPCYVAIGLYLPQLNRRFIRGLRQMLLSISQFLLPILALICVGYLLTLLLGALHTQGTHSSAGSIGLYSFFTLLGIIWINAYYQDGQNIKLLSKAFFSICLLILSACLTLLMLRSLYLFSSDLRLFSQHVVALTPGMVSMLACLILLFAYSLCYFSCWLFADRLRSFRLGQLNQSLACVLIISTLILFNPVSAQLLA
jgi:hypothetical protein